MIVGARRAVPYLLRLLLKLNKAVNFPHLYTEGASVFLTRITHNLQSRDRVGAPLVGAH